MSRLKKHLTPSTAIAFIALIFAVTGVSFAATGGGSGSNGGSNTHSFTASAAKKKAAPKGKAGPRGPAGKNGTNGTNGAPGAQGPAGPTGPAGGPGTPGGTGETGKEGKEGKEGKVGHEGKEGKPGPTVKELESGQSEHGVWSMKGEGGEGEQYVPISFPIPLKETIKSGSDVHLVTEGATGPAECEDGTSAEPKAAPGNLCIYEVFASASPDTPFVVNPEEASIGETVSVVGKSGTLMHWDGVNSSTLGYGVWVVTQE
jgi:hypothetical protein